MVGFGRDLCGSSSPTLPPKQGHLQQAAEDLVQASLEYLQKSVEFWLDKRGHSLVPLSNPGFVSEIGLESSKHGTLLQK